MSSSSSVRRPRLTRLTIEGFRGFRSAMALDFDASAVLLWGPNGTGKTSVFDALEWLLVGDVIRLREYTLRRNDEYLVNAYRLNERACVEAELGMGDRTLRARRRGSARGSSLEVVVDAERHVGATAERVLASSLADGELSLAEVLATSGLLQQDDLRQLLETKPDERYRRLLRLLGLEVLERFDRYAGSRRDRARADVRTARDTLENVRMDARRAQERLDTSRLQVQRTGEQKIDTSALAGASERFADVLTVTVLPSRAEELAALGASARHAADGVRETRAELVRLVEELPPDPAPLLEQARVARLTTEDALAAGRQRQSVAQNALRSAAAAQDAVGRLAAAALPLLAQEQESAACPICGTIIRPREVAEALLARVASAAAAADAQQAAQSADEEVARLEGALDEHRRDEARLRGQSEERRAIADSLRESLAALEALSTAPPSAVLLITVPVGIDLSAGESEHPTEERAEPVDADGLLFSAWAQSRTGRLRELERLVEALLAVADAADTAAAAGSAARLAAERAAAVPQLQAQLEEIQARLQKQEETYDELRRRESDAASLAQRATAAAAEIFRERFDALRPVMNDIYTRLDPHPAFTRLDFRVEPYRSRGTAIASVVDVEESIEANPMLVFSSAQANCVVLAAFLALGWAAGDRALPFVLLDDPLQALDDVNVLGFADLARRLRRQRQLIVATHEERFASLLERKLTGREDGEELIVHHFGSWSRKGPAIETRRVPARADLKLRVVTA